MISKSKIAEIKSLHLKKYRDKLQLFIVEGLKSVSVLLESSFRVREVFVTDRIYRENHTLLQNQPVVMASPVEIARMSNLTTSPEIMAVAEQLPVHAPFNAQAPILVLDHIADPGNMGTIIRTADWFDFTQIVCSPDCVELYNPKVIQASMGSFCHVRVRVGELVPFLREQAERRRIIGTFLEGEPVRNFIFRNNDILVVGSESHGISPQVAALVTHSVTVPSLVRNRASAESLNAAIAAALTMEAFRMS